MGHWALGIAFFTCTCTVAATVTSRGSASPSASSCTNEQVKELGGQSSLLQLVSGSHSRVGVDDTSAQDPIPEDPTKVTFNCKIGTVHWRKGWSDLKKRYCCKAENVGCLDTADVSTNGQEISRRRRSKTGSQETNVTNTTTSDACVTGEPVMNILGYTTSEKGTHCIFGLDQRDEGKHCILSDLKYGSLGWCYTSASRESWGPCSESCPLFGQLKVLGNRVNKLHKEIEQLINLTTTADANASDTGESVEPSATPRPAAAPSPEPAAEPAAGKKPSPSKETPAAPASKRPAPGPAPPPAAAKSPGVAAPTPATKSPGAAAPTPATSAGATDAAAGSSGAS